MAIYHKDRQDCRQERWGKGVQFLMVEVWKRLDMV